MAPSMDRSPSALTGLPHRRRVVGVLLACVILLLSACAPSAAGPSRSGPAATTDTSLLVVAVASLGGQRWVPWLIVQEEMVTTMIGETLVRSNPKTRQLEGGLAESWTLSPDLKTWNFKLRPNIPFQDGYGTVTADDVKFSWDQYTVKDSTRPLAPVYRQAVDGDMKNFEIVGPLEFKLHTTKPVITLPASLSNAIPGMVIQSKKYWDTKPAEALQHPLGTGPFSFVSSTPGVEVQLKAADKHWRQTAAFKAITMRVIADDAARLAQVRSGQVDLAPINPKLVNEAKAAGLSIVSIPDAGQMGVNMGGQFPNDPKFYDPRSPWIQADSPDKGLAIRQALSLAIDRKSILDRIMNGDGTLTSAPIWQYPSNPQLVDPSWKVPAYDVAQAKAMLVKGGYPNGFDLNMPIFELPGRSGQLDVGEAVAGMWESIGIKVKRQPMDYATFRPYVQGRTTAGMAYVTVWPFYEEATDGLHVTITHFYDPVAAAALERIDTEPELNKRYAIAREVLGSMAQSMRAIPLFVYNTPYASSKKVGSWTPVAGLAQPNSLETLTPR